MNQIALERAGRWLLESGIRELGGGIARYYRTDAGANLPISTEITGYGISGLCYLHELTGDGEYLAAACESGDFLVHTAWDEDAQTIPFEVTGDERFGYFFDCGIIARALLWLYRLTGERAYLDRAQAIGVSMMRDFRAAEGFHPIIRLPDCEPEPYAIWWSKMPGAFQLKAALAWLDLATEVNEPKFAGCYEEMLAFGLRRYRETIDNEVDEPKKMDRLHAWAYFLEGLQPVKERAEVMPVLEAALREGEALREKLATGFLRSDVCAQLLRIRLLAGLAPAAGEVERIREFQWGEGEQRTAGGFGFGSRGGAMLPFANPVSTVFCTQALAMAEEWEQGRGVDVDWRKLI